MVRLLIILSLISPMPGLASGLGDLLIHERCLVHWGVGAECVDSVLTNAVEDGYGNLDCYSTVAELANEMGSSDSVADDYVASNGGGTGTGSGCTYEPD